MHWKDVKSLEDIESYVLTNDDRVSISWMQMLEDMITFGDEYDVNDFIDEAILLANKGKAYYG